MTETVRKIAEDLRRNRFWFPFAILCWLLVFGLIYRDVGAPLSVETLARGIEHGWPTVLIGSVAGLIIRYIYMASIGWEN